MLLSRANVKAHTHLVAVVATHNDHEHVVLITMEEWARVREGAAVEAVPGTFTAGMVDGVGEDNDGPLA